MIFYRAIDEDGRLRLAPTQEEAKKINRDFDQIDVPIDKSGLMEVLQDLITRAESKPVPPSAPVQPTSTNSSMGYTEWSVALDDSWDELPLARKLHFAALAMEEARDKLGGSDGVEPKPKVGAATSPPRDADRGADGDGGRDPS